MPEVHGNIEGIRKSVLDELASLYDVQLEPDVFMPQELINGLCGYSASLNREIAVYITRYGEIADALKLGGHTDEEKLENQYRTPCNVYCGI